ncbi:MAG: glycerol kinase GlpK [Bacteroidota bacterium]
MKDNKKYIIAFDQGTTSSRALLVDTSGQLCDIAQKEFTQIFPKPGWVEHNPDEIWATQWEVFKQLIDKNGLSANQIVSIGITNQRETTVIWDRESGKPVYNALVWQDKRTAPQCEILKEKGLTDYVREHTGLVIDSYFCATKIQWILENVAGVREKAEAGKLCFGTIDSWLIWNLTKGKSHVTDHTNASRTMLFDIVEMKWSDKLLMELDIPASLLPSVQPSGSHFGDLEYDGVKIPIDGVAGDQQAALFGQACFSPGLAKNTYGTGCFLLMNMGDKHVVSQNGLLTTLACSMNDKPVYALEGSIFIAGAAIQWLRDGLKLIKHAAETEQLAESTEKDEVVVVPAFAGLGTPYWDMYARGAIFGLTRDTGIPEIAKATLQSLAFQTKDVINAMMEDTGIEIKTLKVDGGACANNYLMQFQSDILCVPVERPEIIESTAMGAAYLAGIQAGIWQMEDVDNKRKIEKLFEPNIDSGKRDSLYGQWTKGVQRVMNWNEK